MAAESERSEDQASDEATLRSTRGHDLKDNASKSEEPDDSVEDGGASPAGKPDAEATNPPLPDEPVPPLPNEEVPPLPDEQPPLPDEKPPGTSDPADDGWEPVWDADQQAFYFYNRFTGVTQWENPRVPEASTEAAEQSQAAPEPLAMVHGGYNPAIHGDYDPTAPYALEAKAAEQRAAGAGASQAGPAASTEPDYSASGQFNRFTGRWQAADQNPENFSDESKSRRQMNAFFDVDAAANSHEGRSLKAERSGMKLSKKDLKAFKDKRREKKEEKRRAWLRD